MPSWNEIPLPEGAQFLRVQLGPEDIAVFRMLGAEHAYSMAACIRAALSLLARNKSVTMEEIVPELERLREEAAAAGHPNSSQARARRKKEEDSP